MKSEKKQVKLDSIVNQISNKCGLSKSMSKRVLQELIDFICLNLASNKDNVIFLPRLGFFYLEEVKDKYVVNYQSSSYIENLLNSSFENTKDFKEELTAYVSEGVKENLNGLSLSSPQEESKFKPGEVSLAPVSRPKNTPDKVRSSFLNYLQVEFVYGDSWEHPITKEVYDKEQIQKALSIYKNYAPSLYNALRFLWVSQYNRATIARHFNVSSSSIRRTWNKAIDSIILIILYPELDPNICIQIYNSRR